MIKDDKCLDNILIFYYQIVIIKSRFTFMEQYVLIRKVEESGEQISVRAQNFDYKKILELLLITHQMAWVLLACVLVLQVVTDSYAQRIKAPNDDISRFKCTIYEQNKTKVEQHNNNSSATYRLETNEFACLTTEEINNYYLGYIPSIQASVYFARKGINKTLPIIAPNIPPSVASSTKQTFSSSRLTISSAATPTISQAQILGKMGGARTFTRANPINAALDPKRTQSLGVMTTLINQQTSTANQINQSNLEQQMRAQVQNYLKGKNIPESTLQKYLPKKNQRLLQSESGPSASQSGFLINPVNPKKETVSTVPTNKGIEIQHSTKYDVDWSCLGGRVKFQGKCGSCYAFAAIDTVATMLAIYQYGFHVELSIQEIIDCPKIPPGATFPLTYGCNGGYLEGALAYMLYNGVLTDYTYPYISQKNLNQTGICKGESSKVVRQFISNFQQIASNDCNQLKARLKKQPIAIGISILKLVLYKDGVFNDCKPEDALDHAVILVGYKEGKGWKFKNSWRQVWGDNGYAWLAPGNTCRICEKAFYPIPKIGKTLDNYNSDKAIMTCPPP